MVNDLPPFIEGRFFSQVTSAPASGVVDDDIECAKLHDSVRDQVVYLLCIGNINGNSNRALPLVADCRSLGLNLLPVTTGDYDVSSRFCIGSDHGSSQATSAACDNRCFSG